MLIIDISGSGFNLFRHKMQDFPIISYFGDFPPWWNRSFQKHLHDKTARLKKLWFTHTDMIISRIWLKIMSVFPHLFRLQEDQFA